MSKSAGHSWDQVPHVVIIWYLFPKTGYQIQKYSSSLKWRVLYQWISMHQWGTNSEYNCPTLGKVEFVSFKLISARMAGIGGVYSWCFWVGVCCLVLKTLTLVYFRPKYTLFHTVFQTWLSKCIPCFRPCNMLRFRSMNVNRIYGVKVFVTPQTMFFFSFVIQCLRQHVAAKKWYPRPNRRNIHPISDQSGKIYTLFQTRNAWKWYLFGVAHTYMAYIWEHPFTPKLKSNSPNL